MQQEFDAPACAMPALPSIPRGVTMMLVCAGSMDGRSPLCPTALATTPETAQGTSRKKKFKS